MKKITVVSLLALMLCGVLGCAGGYGPVAGNENGSSPVNDQEVNDYKSSVLHCYKTGGTRVVKIQGVLRCY